MKRKGRPMTPSKTALGAVIRELRLSLGLTQRKMCDQMGCRWTMLHHIESGETHDINLCTLVRLAEAANIEPQELLSMLLPTLNPKL